MLEVSEKRKNADIEFDQMISDRRDYVDWWRKLSDMFAPNRGRFSVDELPRKRAVRFNTRAMQIPDEFAAGMKSGLTSPSRPWFTLTLYDIGLAEAEGIKAWLTEVQDIMQGTMIRSNLYDQLYSRISCSLMTSVHNARGHYGRNSHHAFRYASSSLTAYQSSIRVIYSVEYF